jgi:HSP90 family molecular chaperone
MSESVNSSGLMTHRSQLSPSLKLAMAQTTGSGYYYPPGIADAVLQAASMDNSPEDTLQAIEDAEMEEETIGHLQERQEEHEGASIVEKALNALNIANEGVVLDETIKEYKQCVNLASSQFSIQHLSHVLGVLPRHWR